MSRKFQDLLTPLCQLLTYGCLIWAVLFLVYTGSHLYEKVTVQKDQNERMRSSIFYLQNQLASNDAEDDIQVEKGPEGDMLVLSLPEEEYQLYIYTYQGYLMEELGARGKGAHPNKAEQVSPVKSFQVKEREGQRMLVQMDDTSAWITLPSGGGKAANG